MHRYAPCAASLPLCFRLPAAHPLRCVIRLGAVCCIVVAGMVATAKQQGYDCEGLLFGITEPSGTIADHTYESMRDGTLIQVSKRRS